MLNYLMIAILIVIVYLCVYGVVNRICDCVERCTLTKAYERAVLYKQELEETKAEFKTGFCGKNR